MPEMLAGLWQLYQRDRDTGHVQGGQVKPYMAFSRFDGPEEGAVLVLAQTAKEARRLAWQSGECLNVHDWIDLAVRWIKDATITALANQDKLKASVSHVVGSPAGCDACGYWGVGVTLEGLCCRCNQPPGEILICLLGRREPCG